ncbi:hypothetical protein DNHGIG_26050 [Collibacillus ludicampi]|uniref:Uncharacterized protein n=1 Tax=Collibacillus ludicampi TaxID=2771369 RepID=A0AAV4LGU3_9BACL|nr:hypothetical protein [Collibacillus ludicampi]GIM47056.1 hypothetical protein DNHGIG_26050 [Collibacillus ludicampi]
MERQLKLFLQNKSSDKSKLDDCLVFSKFVGVPYSVDSKSLWSVTERMTNRGYTQFFFTPSAFKNLLLHSRENSDIRIRKLEFSIQPDEDIQYLLDEFYSDQAVSNHLLKLLYDNDVVNLSLYYMGKEIPAIANIYQSGLIHINDMSDDLSWLDEVLGGVVQ